MRWLIMWLVRILLLLAFGVAVGILIRTQYFGDELVFTFDTVRTIVGR